MRAAIRYSTDRNVLNLELAMMCLSCLPCDQLKPFFDCILERRPLYNFLRAGDLTDKSLDSNSACATHPLWCGLCA